MRDPAQAWSSGMLGLGVPTDLTYHSTLILGHWREEMLWGKCNGENTFIILVGAIHMVWKCFLHSSL